MNMVIFHRLWKQLLVFNSYETMVIWIYGGNTSGKRTIMDYLQYQKVVLIPPKSRRQDLLSRGKSSIQVSSGRWRLGTATWHGRERTWGPQNHPQIWGWVKTNSNHILGNEYPLERAIFRVITECVPGFWLPYPFIFSKRRFCSEAMDLGYPWRTSRLGLLGYSWRHFTPGRLKEEVFIAKLWTPGFHV